MVENDANYKCFIKYLTVPPGVWGDPAFVQNQVAQIKSQLEDPMRRQIFDAMSSNPNGFRFKSLEGAIENIDIRVEAITFMRSVGDSSNSTCQFTPGQPAIAPGVPAAISGWQSVPLTSAQLVAGLRAPGNMVLNSVGGTAHSAIAAFRNQPSSVDCLDAVELIVLEAVDCIIGEDRFNAEHPEGVQNIGLNDSNGPNDSGYDDAPVTGDAHGVSIFKNVRMFASKAQFKLQFSMMVPGDWAYMRNDPRYPNLPNAGGYAGENTIYMGKYGISAFTWYKAKYLKPGDANYSGSAYARYTGLGGEADKTAVDLTNDLIAAFFDASDKKINAVPAMVGWTLIGRIKAGDDGPPNTGGSPPNVNPTCHTS
jgi:hypothetical protein